MEVWLDMSKLGDKILSTFGFEVVYPEADLLEEKDEALAASPAPSPPKSVAAKAPPKAEPAGEGQEEIASHVVLFEMTRIGDVKAVCDELKQDRTVIINVEKLDEGDFTRVFDFVTGACYALKGTMQEMDPNVYVIAPHNVLVRKTDSRSAALGYEDKFDDDFDYEDEEYEY
jgi:cell division inhibitor SepF